MNSFSVDVKLCILVDDQNIVKLKSSISCLSGHPTVEVSLAVLSVSLSTRAIRRYILRRLGNDVNVVDLESLSHYGLHWLETGGSSYSVFLPGGDWLSDDALSRISQQAAKNGPDFIYFDEDQINERGHLTEPKFKPDPSYEYLMHSDYIGDLLCIKNSTLAEYGGINLNDYYSDRYRLLLRAFSDSKLIEHIPLPVYHARKKARIPDAESVLKEHFQDKEEQVSIHRIDTNAYRIKRKIHDNPKVTIIIPFRDRPQLLRQCLESVIGITSYDNYEVLGVSNKSQALAVYEVMTEFANRDLRIRFIEHNIPFNFSALVNYGVSHALGDYIVLMNNDITVINNDWLCALLEHCQRKEVGVVGAKLLYPDDTIQHAGLSVRQTGYIGHLHKHYPSTAKGYMNRLICTHNVSAVTGALCMFSRHVHHQLRGFDEQRFKIALNDVDFCLRAIALGYLNVFTPHSVAYHHESMSRGYEDTEEKIDRFDQERKVFTRLYKEQLRSPDSYYNPNFDQHRDDFSY